MGVIKVAEADPELELVLGRWVPHKDGRSTGLHTVEGRREAKKQATALRLKEKRAANVAANKAYANLKRERIAKEAVRLAGLIPQFGALCITEQNKVLAKLRGQLIKEGFGHE